VFAALDPRQFAECFANWTSSLRKTLSEEIVAIDGKTLRRSHNRARGREAIHMVSAWARENGLVLGQIKVEDKSNQITAIPELLRRLNVRGCIVTIDAMGCQTKIASEIVKAGGDYVLALKGNQSSLHEEVRNFIEDTHECEVAGVKFDYEQTDEMAHGRVESRKYWITEEVKWLSSHAQWENLRSIGMVKSTREIQGKVEFLHAPFTRHLNAIALIMAPPVRLPLMCRVEPPRSIWPYLLPSLTRAPV
jgi:predicted transposase YbfD/YdcC